MKLSMCMIARDEAQNIDRCFSSWWGHVDEVVLVDTGSKDDTIQAARAFAKAKGQPGKLKVAKLKWKDDFAQARTRADKLATGDWLVWCDLDDTIENASQLREIASQQPADITGVFFRYDYGRDENGNTVCELWRERLVRAGHGKWEGRVHECQALDGQAIQVPPARCQWIHHKIHEEPSRRNLDILEQWVKDDPDNPRVLAYLGSERAAHGDEPGVVEALERYLSLQGEPVEHRAQNFRRLACALVRVGNPARAREVALQALGELPSWPDSYLTLAELDAGAKQWGRAIEWAQRAMELGSPSTPLIINPLDYTAGPLAVIASCQAEQGNFDMAVENAEKALEILPGNEGLSDAVRDWQSRSQASHSANTWIACADILIRHDEQLRALALLEDTTPWFIRNHPLVVAKLSALRQQLAWLDHYSEHYEDGGDKPEAFHDDEACIRVAKDLPRAQFLLAGLKAA